ncbi:MAG: lipid-A-disaccharide synthase [Desulfatibacillaceae bacterium]|nr:lipid-A-disaccharide synthase [Desulfatibacillaceae bacterium]
MQKRVLIVAGEASGDIHGAHLVSALRELDPSLYFFGVGGEGMKAKGVRILEDASALGVVGFTEVFASLGLFARTAFLLKDLMARVRPDLVILIDFPDFNLRLAKYARQQGIKVLYYISPQVWAWRRGRVKKIRKWVDHMAVILPFEKDFYASHAVPVTFVGHPTLDCGPEETGSPPVENRPENLLVGLIPGSRSSEVARHLPIMLEAASLVLDRFEAAQFAIPLAPTVDSALVGSLLADAAEKDPRLGRVQVWPGGINLVLEQSTAAIAVSGTVTLEAALAGTPIVIIYRMSSLSYQVGRLLIKVDFVGLPNLIAGRPIVPELLQNDVNPQNIAKHLLPFLENPAKRQAVSDDLKSVRSLLGGPGASRRTAGVAHRLLEDL